MEKKKRRRKRKRKKEEKEKKQSISEDNKEINPSANLGEFFSLIGKAKQEKEDEFRFLVGDVDSDIDSLFLEVKKSVKEDTVKKKKIKENEKKQIKALESWLYSDSNSEEEIVDIEENKNTIHEEELINSNQSEEDNNSELEEPVEIEEEDQEESEEVEDNYIDEALKVLETIKTKEEVQEQTGDPEIIKIRRELEYLKNLVNMQGGGGEVRLEFLDDVDRDTALSDGKFLKYNASTKKFVGADAGGVGGGGVGLSTTGISTAFGLHIDPIGSGTTFTEDLVVIGEARVTGILSIGTSSIVLDPSDNSIGFDDVKIRRDHSTGDVRFIGDDGNLKKIIASEVAIGSGLESIVIKNKSGQVKFMNGNGGDDEISVGIGTTSSVETTGIITASQFFVGSTEVINISGEFVGNNFGPNVDGGVPSSVYGGLTVIDGGGV